MEKSKRMSGAQIFFECLKNQNVETIFGYPGGAVLPFYDTLYDIKDLEHILVRHEQGAVHMAEGYSKATGRPGVVLVTSGPGATNTVTGITDAFMDSIPLVIFTGQVPRSFLGLDSFQEADVIGVTRPITKWNKLVRSPKELLEAIPKAFKIATSGRPGPVLIDIPKDVALEEMDFFGFSQDNQPIKGPKVSFENKTDVYLKVLEAIKKAKRPLLYFGGGIIQSEADQELKEIVEYLNIPVTSTLQGLGGIPGDHPNFLGMLGMHGTYASNMAVDHCDLLLVLGARFDDRVTGKTDLFSKDSYKIHFDIDPSNMDKTITCDINVQGDLKTNLKTLLPLLKEDKKALNKSIKEQASWWENLISWKKECPQLIKKEELGPTLILSELNNTLKENKTHFSVVTDVGQNQMWASQYLQFQRPKTHITSGGLGTMGFSVPAAIGASLGKRGKEEIVISISGDGGFQMNMQELITASTYQVPVKFIILNNSYLGMVRQWQELFHKERFSFTSLEGANPDFCLLANSMGVPSKRLEKLDDVNSSIEWLLKPGTKLLECIIPQEEMVFPIIPSNSSVKDIITERFSKEEK